MEFSYDLLVSLYYQLSFSPLSFLILLMLPSFSFLDEPAPKLYQLLFLFHRHLLVSLNFYTAFLVVFLDSIMYFLFILCSALLFQFLSWPSHYF